MISFLWEEEQHIITSRVYPDTVFGDIEYCKVRPLACTFSFMHDTRIYSQNAKQGFLKAEG